MQLRSRDTEDSIATPGSAAAACARIGSEPPHSADSLTASTERPTSCLNRVWIVRPFVATSHSPSAPSSVKLYWTSTAARGAEGSDMNLAHRPKTFVLSVLFSVWCTALWPHPATAQGGGGCIPPWRAAKERAAAPSRHMSSLASRSSSAAPCCLERPKGAPESSRRGPPPQRRQRSSFAPCNPSTMRTTRRTTRWILS